MSPAEPPCEAVDVSLPDLRPNHECLYVCAPVIRPFRIKVGGFEDIVSAVVYTLTTYYFLNYFLNSKSNFHFFKIHIANVNLTPKKDKPYPPGQPFPNSAFLAALPHRCLSPFSERKRYHTNVL